MPSADKPELTPGVVLAPLLAFDRSGYRLGYGGGFYDRTLERLRADGPVLAVGLAYAAQEVPEVPRDPNDKRLDWIVTEAEAIRWSRADADPLLRRYRGRPGRSAVTGHVPDLRARLGLDFVIANGENAAGGFGITKSICEELFASGVDAITGGNHMWDQREAIQFIGGEPRLIRPLNYPDGTPGRGSGLFEASRGRKVLVVSVMARLFMDPLDDPFAAVDRALERHRLGASVQAIVLDVHGEATSEKMAMGHFVDGRVSLCVGTHTHVPTADTMVLDGGTAYQSDAGMCGSYDSIIGHGQVCAACPLHPQAADRTAFGRQGRGHALWRVRRDRR